MTHASHKRSAFATQILAYLRKRPTAADTARGVCDWWVGGKAPMDLPAVEAALEELAAEHLVRVDVLPEGTRVWSAGPALPDDSSPSSSNDG